MRKAFKKITALILCIMMFIPFVSFQTSAAENRYEYTFEMQEATSAIPMLFIYEYNGIIYFISHNTYTNKISITQFTKNLELISKKHFTGEMPHFGGFFSGKTYNYIAYGQNNLEEDLEKETYRIVKYDKEFNRISHASINGEASQSISPYYHGGCSFAESGNELTIHTARHYFTTYKDGLNHQAQFTIVLNTNTMTPINKLGFYQDNHVSHSFDQYVKYDNGKRVLIDEGDAYPRSIYLQRYEGLNSFGEKYTDVNLFEIPGEIGNNYIGVNVGGFEISENNYIVSMSSIYKNELILESKKYSDAVLLVCDKNNPSKENTKEIYLTDHVKDNKYVSDVKLVKLSEKRFVVLWDESDGVRYVFIDQDGQMISQIKTIENSELWQDCQVVFIDNKLVWAYPHTENRNMITVVSYDISSDLNCKHSVVNIPAKAATCSETGNIEHYKCTKCGFCFKNSNATSSISSESVVTDCIPHHSDSPYCSNNGNLCSDCGTCFIPKQDHTPGKLINSETPTCTSYGYNEYICSNCNIEFRDYLEKLGHTFENTTTVTEPTCTTEGELYGYCTTCQKTILDKIPKAEHTPGEWVVTAEATCKKEGSRYSYCVSCGKYITEIIPPKEHIAEGWSYEHEPTCQKWGYKQRNCSVCRTAILMEYTPPLGHQLGEWITIQAPTKEKAGEKVKICSVCSWIVEREAISPSEAPDNICTTHTPGEWETVFEATCEEKGFRIRKCSVCGYALENEYTEATGHNDEKVFTIPLSCHSYAEGYYVCTICGRKGSEFNYLYKLDHKPGDWEVETIPSCGNPGVKVKKCTECNEVVETGVIPAINSHVPGTWETVREATCSVPGEKVTKCTSCKTIIETKAIPVKSHTPGTWETVSEAKCGVDGTEIQKCTVCKEKINERVIPAPEHIKSDWIVTENATCSKEGVRQKKCTVCNTWLDYEKIAKVSHTPANNWINQSVPTCTKEGLKIKKCTVCSEVAEEQVIPANGHMPTGDWITEISPTCDGAGKKIKYCSVCKEIAQEIIINPTGHSTSDEWILRKEATCTENGEYYKKCTVCGMDAETKVIPAPGHSFNGEWVVTKPATCTENGIKTRYCSGCNQTVTETVVASGHSVGEWVILENATCLKAGRKIKSCYICNNIIYSETIPVSGHSAGNWIITKTPQNGNYGIKSKFCTGCGMKLEEKIIHSINNSVVRDAVTGIEIIYPEESFDGNIAMRAGFLSGSDLGNKVFNEIGKCTFKGYEATLIHNGEYVTPEKSYSLRLPLPDGMNHKTAEVYAIDTGSGRFVKVDASYENGYFLIDKVEAVQYVVIERIITLTLSEANLSLKKGDSVQIHAYTEGSNVTYTSSNSSVATVDIHGNIKAVGAGTATITATVDGTTVKAECSVEVTQSFFDMIIEAFTNFFKMIAELFGF